MKSFTILLKNELKLNLRNMNMVIFAILMPLVILLIFGFIYGNKPAAEGEAYTFMEKSFSALCCISICSGGLMGLPLLVSEYRERKILKRFQVTPVSPTKLLTVEFAIYILYSAASMLLLFPVAALFWQVRLHGSLTLFLGCWLLTMLSTLSLGLLVGGIAKNQKTASVIACLLYFPMLFFSGITVPLEVMPDIVQKIVLCMPLTQGMQLMQTAFLGLPINNILLTFAFLSIVTLLCFGSAVKYFKWE